MKQTLQLFVYLFISLISLHSQKVYFIYLQTDNQLPFYVRLGEKVYNSNPSGYLILSNLRDSNYTINIGLQGVQSADQSYEVVVNRKDQGYLVKNFGDKGWGLFNLTTMATIMPAGKPISTVQTVKTEKREDNEFTDLLARAADDSTIREKPIIEKPVETKIEPVVVASEKKEITETVKPVQDDSKRETVSAEKKDEPKFDSVAIVKQMEEDKRAAQIKADSILEAKNREAELIRQEELRKQDSIEKTKTETITEVDYKRSEVKLKSESSTTTGIGLVFVDRISDQTTDTIRILIPPDNRKTTPIETPPAEKKFLDISSTDSTKKEDTKSFQTKADNCKVLANDEDFFELRKDMAGENGNDNMIAVAVKIFKTKCFSTIQMKNLSSLFLSDEFKYRFFDAAYPYVSDPENFSSLQSELKDDYYINRFKAMLRI